MHIQLTALLMFPLLASAATNSTSTSTSASASASTSASTTTRKPDRCNLRGISRYVALIPKAQSSNVKSWCAAQTTTANVTVDATSTTTILSAVTLTRTRTKETKTVTLHRNKTSTSTGTFKLAVRNTALAEPVELKDESATANIIKRSLPWPIVEPVEKRANITGHKPGNWTGLPDQAIQVLCACMDSPWKTRTTNGTRTRTHWKTKAKVTTTTGTTTETITSFNATVTSGTTTTTVDGEATVRV
ncbi:hypothetical protein ABW20_dc0105336 [Dactylellina cionopaga]|nr:hypothetical protein ABW20_dc0105336 [Dactylellina cionopaga]